MILSSAEVLAILLHEVGHNFDTAVLPGFLGLPILRTIAILCSNPMEMLPYLLALTTPTRILDNAINNLIQKNAK